MGYASRAGRARVSSRNPQAFGVCDRCGMWYNHADLQWQFDWAGASLINKRILVCETCYDDPQQQLRAIVLPADPEPIINPRTEPYFADEADIRQVSGYNTVNPILGISYSLNSAPSKTRRESSSSKKVTLLSKEPTTSCSH